MAASKDPMDWCIVFAWLMAMVAFTTVMTVDYYKNETTLKHITTDTSRTWDDAAWECRSPVSGSNAQMNFKGSLIQQLPGAQDRLAFAPELRSACHHCRAEDGNRMNGHELFIPGGANATVGISAALLSSRTGLLSLGGFFNNALPADARVARCATADTGSFYIVWDNGAARPHICHCRSGVEYCSDSMLTSGEAELNCVGGSTSGLPTDCSGCSDALRLC